MWMSVMMPVSFTGQTGTKIRTWSSGPLMDCDRKSTLRGLKEESFLISMSVVKRVLLENLFKGIT
jgi:hypothetical protein